MMEKLRFYITHSINDLRVNGQRTLFALLCIAAGVAAIVSLQTTGVMIENALTGSLQETNKGDIQLRAELDDFTLTEAESAQVGEDGLITPDPQFEDYFNEFGLETILAWFEENYPGEATITTRARIPITQANLSADATGETTAIVFPFVVDVTEFPLYGTIETVDGRSLSEAITRPTDMIVSEKIAEDLGLSTGDIVKIGGATEHFEVTGIIPDSSTIVGSDFFAAVIGFYVIDEEALPFFPRIEETSIASIYVELDDPSRAREIGDALLEEYPYITTVTTEDLREQNETIASGIKDLVSVMGLLSMLIGGIGIINTMQVIVRRRTLEVAVLKTIGLQGGQVTTLFLVEALVMGVIGSIGGVLAGWALVFVFKRVAEPFTGPLPYTITPGPSLTGLVVGVLVTAVFGFLPTLSAAQVRPALVLRPSGGIPRVGRLKSILAVLLVVVVVALIAAGFIGLIAAAVVPGAFLAVGVLYLLLLALVWLVGRFFPSFGIVDLKVSLRAMLAGRTRAAITLLALVVGVFVLSVITLLTGTVLRQLQQIIELETGGNVIIASMLSTDDTQSQIDQILSGNEGVESFSTVASYSVRIVEVQHEDGSTSTYQDIIDRVNELGALNNNFGPPPEEGEERDFSPFLDMSFGLIDARDVVSNLPDLPFYAGRQLTTADSGEPHIIISRDNFTANAGINVGDQITFAFENSRLAAFGITNPNAPKITYQVMGILDRTSSVGGGFTAAMYVPVESIPDGLTPDSVSAVAEIEESQIPVVRQQLDELPGVLFLETKLLNDLINSLVEQFTSFPILVAALSLLVGGIVIANSVALTTMERRHEIAVMKSVGLQRERVLGMLLLENGLMGMIGGILGVGLGIVMLLVILTLSFPGISIASAVPYSTAFLLMMLCVVIAVGAALLASWGASGEKPLNVLRYE